MINNYNVKFLTGGFVRTTPDWTMDVDHQDHCYKLYLPIKGSVTLVMNGERRTIEPEHLYFISGWHIDRQECEDFMEVFWMHFTPDSLQLRYVLSQAAAFHAIPAPDIAWAHKALKQLNRIFQPFHENHKLSQRLRPQIPNDLMCRLQSILLFVIGDVLKDLDQEAVEETMKSMVTLQKASDFMDRYFLENPSLEEIAEQVHLAPNYFHKVFRNAFGTTPFNYMLNLRMNLAKERLSFSPRSIKEIAAKVGYGNEFHFSKTFKKHVGMSPKVYRQRRPTA